MSAIINAPFTDEQVANLHRWQHTSSVHPFTCANRDDGHHWTTYDHGCLTPTRDGWICPSCDYTQPWAHSFMLAFDIAALQRVTP